MRLKSHIKLLIIIYVLCCGFKAYSQQDQDKVKAYFIYNFIEQTDWPKENTFSEYSITVLNPNKGIKIYLNQIASTLKIRDKPIVINYLSNSTNIHSTNILFINKSEGVNYPLIQNKLIGKSTLLVGMNLPTDDIMINLIMKGDKIYYKLNLAALQSENLIISKQLLALAVTDQDDWTNLYSASQEKLKSERNKVQFMDSVLSEQKKENELQQLRLKIIEDQIDLKKKEINFINEEIAKLSETLSEKEKKLNQKDSLLLLKKNQLMKSLHILELNEKKISDKLIEIKEHKKTLKRQQNRLDLQTSRLEEQEETIVETQSTISNLQNLIFNFRTFLISIGILLLISIWALRRSNTLKKRLKEVNNNLETRVIERTSDLQKKNKELEEFTYITSHDLQEPINNIKMLSALLKEDYGDKFNGDGNMFVQEIENASDRLKEQINSILDFSRIGTGEKNYQEVVNLNSIMEAIKSDIKVLLEENNVDIVLPNSLPNVLGNGLELRLLFMNLFTNAIKYNSKSLKTIEVKTNKNNSRWEIWVSDNGNGIEEKYFNKIFVIFQRLEERDSTIKGTGIGLAHCKKIVESHGGIIKVKSKMGAGTSFGFDLKAV